LSSLTLADIFRCGCASAEELINVSVPEVATIG
jgi:hypothetical protein